jgi:regulator of sirC expression with transglutaminase-like and TPR domain
VRYNNLLKRDFLERLSYAVCLIEVAGAPNMDAQDCSADLVEVEASGRRKSKVAALVRARSVDYQPIIDHTVAALARPTAHTRCKIYAHARLVVARGLISMGLAEAVIEVEKLALDLAIEKVEQRWRAEGAAEKSTAQSPAAEQAITIGNRLTRNRAVLGFRPSLEIGWHRVRSLCRVPEIIVYAVSARAGIRWRVARGGNEARRPATPDPSRGRRRLSFARSRRWPAAMRATRFNVLSATAIASIAARLPRNLTETVSVAVALPVIAAMILLVLHIDGRVVYRSAADDPVGRSLSDPRGGPSVRSATAAQDVSAHRGRAQAAAIHVGSRADQDAPAPSPANARAMGEGDAACTAGPSTSDNSCARDIAGASAAAQTPKTQATRLESYSPFSDMTWGFGPSNALRGPTVAAEDFVVGRVIAYAAPTADAALPSPAAAPRAAATPTPQSSPKPINPKIVVLIASAKQAALTGDLDRAVRDFSEAIRIDPEYPDGYLARGQTYFKLGQTERAIADYSAALAHDPQHAAALRARGMAQLFLGKNDLALADLSKAIELGEKDPQLLAPIELFYARRSRGAIYDSTQQYDREIADCTVLIESAAHDPVLAEDLAANYGTAGTANTLAKLYRQRANALARTSSVEQALLDLTAAIGLSSDRGYAALLDRAKLHELLGRRDLALADARAALKIRPSSEEARLALNRLSGLSKPTPPNGL